MKTKMHLFAVLAALSPSLHAQEGREFPYIAPINCQTVINSPEGASIFYRSEYCGTVYVLPPALGDLDYSVSLDSINDQDCDDLDQSRLNRRKLNDKKAALEDEAFKTEISDSKLKRLERQIELAQKSLEDLDTSIKYMSALEGATMAVRLSAKHPEEVNRFFQINKDAFRNMVNFEPMPISESYVSFDVGNESAADTRPAVIRTNIPGVEVRGIKSAPQSDSRIMNGSVTGKVVLGLNAICNMRAQEQVASIRQLSFKPNKMEAYLPANLTYSVPVMSSYSYEASMNYEMVIRDLFTQFENRGQFDVNLIKKQIIEANGGQNIKWKFTAYELQNRGVDNADLIAIDEREKDAVFAGWARDVADRLVKMGILEKLTPTPAPAPPAGTQEETYYREVCRSKSVLGVRYSHRCWQEPYRVVTLRNGTADNAIEEIRKLNLTFTQSVRYSQPIFRTHTSTFKYRQAKESL